MRTAEAEPVDDVPSSVGRTDVQATKVSVGSVLTAVARRLVPHLIEATAIPTALFYLSWVTLGPIAAYTTALAWSSVAIGRRLVRGVPVPAILLLAGSDWPSAPVRPGQREHLRLLLPTRPREVRAQRGVPAVGRPGSPADRPVRS